MATLKESVRLELNQASEVTAFSASSAFGASLKGGDYKTVFIFTNSGNSSVTATIAVGNGSKGMGEPIAVTVGTGKSEAIVVDSAYFKNVSGEYAGYATITPSASLGVQIIELP